MLEYFGGPIEHGTANNRVTSVQKSWQIGKHHAWFQSQTLFIVWFFFRRFALQTCRGRTDIDHKTTQRKSSLFFWGGLGGGGGKTQFASRKHSKTLVLLQAYPRNRGDKWKQTNEDFKRSPTQRIRQFSSQQSSTNIFWRRHILFWRQQFSHTERRLPKLPLLFARLRQK